MLAAVGSVFDYTDMCVYDLSWAARVCIRSCTKCMYSVSQALQLHVFPPLHQVCWCQQPWHGTPVATEKKARPLSNEKVRCCCCCCREENGFWNGFKFYYIMPRRMSRLWIFYLCVTKTFCTSLSVDFWVYLSFVNSKNQDQLGSDVFYKLTGGWISKERTGRLQVFLKQEFRLYHFVGDTRSFLSDLFWGWKPQNKTKSYIWADRANFLRKKWHGTGV